MGMCPLALFLAANGDCVEGFDDNPNPAVLKLLESAGVKIADKRLPSERADKFIITSALARQIGELKKSPAKEFLRRGEALAQISNKRKLIAVCGSHGKTTTTGLLAHAINKENLDAGFMVGALPQKFSPVKYCEENKIFAAEIDESDATIENFSPFITLALNGDLDHTDTYSNPEALTQMFARLFRRTKFAVVIPEGDRILLEAAQGISAKTVIVKVDRSNFLHYDKQMALAAINQAFAANFTTQIFDGFEGVSRRQETLKNDGEIFAIADYAHHPNEVKSFLRWLDEICEGRKLIFFQPHRYTRTKHFAADFRSVFQERINRGDSVFILPVYAASELPDPDGFSNKILPENLLDFSEMKEEIEKLKKSSQRKLNLAFIGAGDIYFKAKDIFKNEKI